MIEVQRHATHVLLEVLRGRSLTAVLGVLWGRHAGLTGAERAAIQDLAYGTCRWLGTLREVLRLALNKPLGDADVEALLLVALYQLHWTRAPAHAVVDSAVRGCVRLGKASAKGLVNAVLRRFQREGDRLLEQARTTPVGRFSYPQWWIERLERDYPGELAAILDAGNLHPPLTLRVNRRRISAAAYLERLSAAGLPAEQIGPVAVRVQQPVPVESLPGFGEGLVSVQDLAAQRAAELLDVSDGMRVLDACAAPGGKTAHLLETAAVDLTAIDRDAGRLQRVRESLRRLNLEAELVAADAAALETWWDGKPFERVLLDAPCSASGVVRRHPDIKWLRRDADIERLAHEQQRLLAALWQTLSPGGTFLYATCSLFSAENQAPIAEFRRAHKNACALPITRFAQTDGQLLPDSRQDGFFYALLQKRAGEPA
jgi:16S rRNA (cytosine967-C5)-methyltransferase